MLFINNNQTQSGKRCKKSGSRSYHDLNFTSPGSFKLIIPLPLRKAGVQYGNLISKPSIKSSYGLVSQGNFRNQHDHLSALPDDLFNKFHIDLCFSTSRNSMKNNRTGLRLFPFLLNLFQGFFLYRTEHRHLFSWNAVPFYRHTAYLILLYTKNSLFSQRLQH